LSIIKLSAHETITLHKEQIQRPVNLIYFTLLYLMAFQPLTSKM